MRAALPELRAVCDPARGVLPHVLLVGCFEGIENQRGVARRCADSRSLTEFLGSEQTDPTPAHNLMTGSR